MSSYPKRFSLILGMVSFIFSMACNSAPQPIPFFETRALAASSSTLSKIEEQIVAKKAEQDTLDIQLHELDDKIKKDDKNEALKKQRSRLEKEQELREAELGALIGRHQLEAARLLKKTDIEAREKTVVKLDEKVADKQKALAEAK